ncbi:cellulose binding domain-containing protein [Streptomyces sp. NPDC051018]|uniref:cellulose binding domain-containing protein n=1 Tax=Streptomyces sp. NPDC051018 TaxID=3365639 RepID=UPI0037B549C9
MATSRRRRKAPKTRGPKVLLLAVVVAAACAAAYPLWGHFQPESTDASEPSDLTVRYRTTTDGDPDGDSGVDTDAARPSLEIFNVSGSSVPLSEVVLRYYFTADGGTAYAFNCAEAAMGCSNVTGTVRALESASETADHYLEIGFTRQAGALKAGANSRGLELQLFRTDGKPLKQDNDWSFDGAKDTYREFDRITAYRGGALVWGKGPGGKGGAAGPAPRAGSAVTLPRRAAFNNFNYLGPKDPALFKHGWLVRTSRGGPGIEGTWTGEGVSFPADDTAQDGQAVRLRASTDGTRPGTRQAGIGSKEPKFRAGTYAARVHFTDKPTSGRNGDPINQTFFTIGGSGTKYSELDYEYMPNGGWGAPGPKLDTTSWRNADKGDRVTRKTEESLAGWRTMMITIDESGVTYSMDGRTLYRNGKDYTPRADMAVQFNTWFVELEFTGERVWDMKVDWVYHQAGATLSAKEVERIAEGFRDSGVNYFDTMPAS